jgi:hypothetical protein
MPFTKSPKMADVAKRQNPEKERARSPLGEASLLSGSSDFNGKRRD